MSGASPALSVRVAVRKTSVLVPTTRAVESSDIGVPSMVIPVAPGLSVLPARAMVEGKSVIGSVPIVITGGETGGASGVGKGIVELPAIIPAELREMGIEAMVMAGRSNVSVWEPMMTAEGLRAEAGRPATVRGGLSAMAGSVFWLLRGRELDDTIVTNRVGRIDSSLSLPSGRFVVSD